MRQGIEHSVYVGNLKRIWGLVRALEAYLGDEATALMRDYVEELTGQRSTKGLSETQARGVIAYLEGRRENYGRFRDDGTVQPKQVQMIEELAATLGWDNEARLRGFCKRVLGGFEWPRDSQEAAKVVEGLKGIVTRGFGAERLEELMAGVDRDALTDWEREFLGDVEGQIARHGHVVRVGAVGKVMEIVRARKR